MNFIHGSNIKTHGNLKSTNCLVDSRWMIKLTDYGLHKFKQGEKQIETEELAAHGNTYEP